ncbi:hypothetical protein D3C78_1036140 [compost metagenome]
MAVEAVLLGQALAVAQQLPGQRGEGVVQRHGGIERRLRQADAVAGRIEQPVAALGLADVAGHQRQLGGQLDGQLQQRGGIALAQLQLQLADFLVLLAGDHLAEIQRRLDHHLGLAAAPGDLGLVADEVGGEDRLEGLLVQLGQFGRPALVGQLLQVQLVLVQRPVPLVALGQSGDALPAALQRLDELLAVAAQAQGDFGLGQLAAGGVEVLVEQLAVLPAALVALLQQRVLAQGGEGGATGAQLDFGFFDHDWRVLPLSDNCDNKMRARWRGCGGRLYNRDPFQQGFTPCRSIPSSACLAAPRSGRCSSTLPRHTNVRRTSCRFSRPSSPRTGRGWKRFSRRCHAWSRKPTSSRRACVSTCRKACSCRCHARICWSCSVYRTKSPTAPRTSPA